MGLLAGVAWSAGQLIPSEQDWGAGLGGDTVGLVLHQARRALATRDAGSHTVGCQLPQGDVPVKAGAGTGWATLIKHEAAVQGAAHHCGQSGRQGHRPVSRLRPNPVTLPKPSLSRPEPSVSPPPPAFPGHWLLTTECGAPPGRCHPCTATVAGIGFQSITEAGVSRGTGPASTEVIHAGGKEGVWWHHSMAAAERGRLQHRTPGVGLTSCTVPCCPAWIHLTALGTGPTRPWALWDLGGEGGPDMTASTGS